ncbi:DUF4232 domain-containing protein [Amycolatopsis jiangsuensis]|uniref:DUF4232 domain-containing protein n=1 Tax=Amycolatopsis jiangsuensis TaxID=1181879 RepID=A0A840IP01_9PSEU|nr:DUF4232 domain-containing protein [Amycolatopsis jiangsuensis]MBB4684171.1 hypothetical protein [Amycolatopsis jiangsuensis]
MSTRTTVAHGALAGGAVLAAVILAGCGSTQDTASPGSATQNPPATSAAPTAASSTTPPPSSDPATSSTTSQATATSATEPPSDGSSGSSGSMCRTADLRVSLNKSAGDADMQGSHLPLVFTNTGSRSCTLQSAPGVSYVTGGSGQQVGVPATRRTGGPVVTIAPGSSASAALFLSSAPHKSDCAQVQARGLRIYPPGNTAAAFIPMQDTTCSDGGPYLRVGSVHPGSATTAS